MISVTPTQFIVPIISTEENGGFKDFLGTGSFVFQANILVTCRHVVEEFLPQIAIADMSQPGITYRAKLIRYHPSVDLALLEVEEYRAPIFMGLGLPQKGFDVNRDVVTMEYSTSQKKQYVGADGRSVTSVIFNPATRKGNITRTLLSWEVDGLSNRYPLGNDPLELSFPVIGGASGAPVFTLDSPSLVGVIAGNVGYHLHPAQVLTVLDENNQIFEETKYMLPQGLAINVRHVSELVVGNITT